MRRISVLPILAVSSALASGCFAQPFAVLKPGDKAPDFKLQVFGCSPQPLDVTTAFARQGKHSFPVLADPTHAAALAYGCLGPDGVASERWTFLIDDRGVITAVNRNTSPQTQGADLVKMLSDAGLMAGATATTPQPAASAPVLKPGVWFTVKFPEMPPTLFALATQRPDPAMMTVFLPRNYDPQRKHPLFIFLNGNDGGNASNPTIARALTEEQDFVCVALPLFKAHFDLSITPGTRRILVQESDGRYAWPYYRTMLEKLDEMVPNLDSAHQVLGGFSNGAHMVAGLLNESDGEAACRFSAFLLGDGGGGLRRFDLLKDKPLLMVCGVWRPKTEAVLAAGVKLTVHRMAEPKHAFPASEYPAVREWLRGPALQSSGGETNGGVE